MRIHCRLLAILVGVTSPLLVAAPTITPATAPAPSNHLAGEKSPYLLQHVHNPVDWYPWGAAAFEKAKKESKPIFLSVGYSTCHWCHVMERESFENLPIARLLNEHFVAIKVDREERPDVDRLYMTFVQASTGSGGWPMNVFLTPDLKPFFGGTYFPPVDQQGRPGLVQVLLKVQSVWESDREKIVESAGKVTAFLQEAAKGTAPAAAIEPATFQAAADGLRLRFDEKSGGFGRAPKFPEPVYLNFLIRHYAGAADAASKEMVLKTLASMAAGGIHDQLGGGFHRYATDAQWFLPHFEKMLYDQAQLAVAYVDAYQLTRDPAFADTARDILDYVLRDLTGDAGQFFSAEDADSATDAAEPSEKSEGAFYAWTAGEITETLAVPKATAAFEFMYGVAEDGNVAVDPRKELTGKNVLSVTHTLAETAAHVGLPVDQTATLLADARSKLLARRIRRPRPHRDDKALAAWNGLAICAFAKAGAVLDEPRYRAAARRAAVFLREHLYDATSHELKRRYRDGQANVEGFAEDYAFCIQGLIDLYETTFEIEWLKLAIDLQAKQDELFWDGAAGGYFSTPVTDTLLTRFKPDEDNVEPGANSVAALNLLRLAAMLDDSAARERAMKTLAAFGGKARQSPESLTQLLVAAMASADKPVQLVLAGKAGSTDLQNLLRQIHATFIPNKILLLADGGEGQAFLADRVKFIREIKPVEGKATAFVCRDFVCQLPTRDPAKLRRLLAPMPATRPAGGD